MARVVVTLSGGKASAWCGGWALRNFKRSDVILYFNDTKWEHPDLYRFLSDLERHWKHPITYDSDGRSPEELFRDNRALANNRMPFCSRILKAERLQSFYKHGDTLIFGIGTGEAHRAHRLVAVYQKIAAKTGKWPKLKFPLIAEAVTKQQIDTWLGGTGIEQPELYRLGFEHNNCSGGCVRAGKASWARLYRTLPDVYAERERVEQEMGEHLCKRIHYLKDETLAELREKIERNEFDDYNPNQIEMFECVGVCETLA